MLRRIFVPVVALNLLIVFGCEKITGKVKPNIPPTITFTNIPPETTGGDTTVLEHGTEVCWEAHDEDGLIVRYDWAYGIDTPRWNTIYTDDSMATQASVPFYIPTPDTYVNTVWVRAMDNDSAFSPVINRTYKACGNKPPFDTRIETGPGEGEILFVLPHTTEMWEGIEFMFTVDDSDQILLPEFSWKWDDGEWSEWNRDRIYHAIGDDIALVPDLPGFHTFYVRSRDDSEREDTSIVARTIDLVYPTFEREIFLIDETWDKFAYSTDEEVDAFYELILGARDVVPFENSGVDTPFTITPKELADYPIVIYHSDDYRRQSIGNYVHTLNDYLNVGGCLWLIGTKNLAELQTEDFEFERYFGVTQFAIQNQEDFVGAKSVQSSDLDLMLDTLKFPLTSRYRLLGAIDYVEIVHLGTGTERLFKFDSKTDATEFENEPCGWNFASTCHKVVVFTFPLYWTEWNPTTGEPVKSVANGVLEFLDTGPVRR